MVVYYSVVKVFSSKFNKSYVSLDIVQSLSFNWLLIFMELLRNSTKCTLLSFYQTIVLSYLESFTIYVCLCSTLKYLNTVLKVLTWNIMYICVLKEVTKGHHITFHMWYMIQFLYNCTQFHYIWLCCYPYYWILCPNNIPACQYVWLKRIKLILKLLINVMRDFIVYLVTNYNMLSWSI